MRGLKIACLLLLLSAAPLAAQVAPSMQPPTGTYFEGYVKDPVSIQFQVVNPPAGGNAGPFVLSGTAPPGLTFNPLTGLLSGTLTATGSYSFSVSRSYTFLAFGGLVTVTGNYTFAVDNRLVLLTPTPLPPATSGVSMTRLISANMAAYWDTGSGNLPAGISFIFPGGELGGPTLQMTGVFPQVQTPTTYNFIVYVSAFNFVEQFIERTYAITVNPPPQISANLPTGQVGQPYSGTLSAQGGTAPFSFSISSGAGALPPGLSLNASTGAITGTPTATGTYIFVARLTDANGAFSESQLRIDVQLPPLTLNEAALPEGLVGSAYSAALRASGGTVPYSFSVSGGSLPPGLALNTDTGVLSGTPTLHGAFTFEATVTDSNQPPLSASRTFTVTIELPPLSPLTITQIQETVQPASQPSFGLQLAQSFPAELNGTAELEFAPEAGLPPDPAVRFANGSTSVNFTIPAGQAAAVPSSGSLFALQTGTTAGTITIRARLRLGSTVLNPDPYSVKTVRIPAAGPQITRLVIVRNPTGFEVQVTGYTNTRQITGATFRFTPAPGATLTAAEVNVPVASAFQAWFASEQSRQYGGQFLLVVPFTLQGSAGALASVQVTLTNSAGSGSATASF